MNRIRTKNAVDLYCGAGGTSTGLLAAASELGVRTTKDRFDGVCAKAEEEGLFDGTATDLMDYIVQYRNWLRSCGGYRLL